MAMMQLREPRGRRMPRPMCSPPTRIGVSAPHVSEHASRARGRSAPTWTTKDWHRASRGAGPVMIMPSDDAERRRRTSEENRYA
jgi:hypothetical protein